MKIEKHITVTIEVTDTPPLSPTPTVLGGPLTPQGMKELLEQVVREGDDANGYVGLPWTYSDQNALSAEAALEAMRRLSNWYLPKPLTAESAARHVLGAAESLDGDRETCPHRKEFHKTTPDQQHTVVCCADCGAPLRVWPETDNA